MQIQIRAHLTFFGVQVLMGDNMGCYVFTYYLLLIHWILMDLGSDFWDSVIFLIF